MPAMAENVGTSDTGSAAGAMRIMGRVLGQARGTDYSVYLLQVDSGPPYIAADHEGELVIRSALTGEGLDDQGLTRQVRTAIALRYAGDIAVTAEQDEDGAWCAQAVLAPGVAAFGSGATQQDAIDECNDGLELLLDELRTSA